MKLLKVIYKVSIITLLCLNLLAVSFILRTNINREAHISSMQLEVVELRGVLLEHMTNDQHMNRDTKDTVYATKDALLALQTALNERLGEIDPNIREQIMGPAHFQEVADFLEN